MEAVSSEKGAKLLLKDAFFNNNEVKWNDFPYKIVDVEAGTNAELLRDFHGEKTGFVQVGPKRWFFPDNYKRNAEVYYNFQPRPDDVWIVTFPRSGTTLTQELVWLLANNLDYEKAAQISLELRYPFLEFDTFIHPEMKKRFLTQNSGDKERFKLAELVTSPAWEFLAQTSEKRFIKTHLPFSLLPPNLLDTGCKVIYLARNPKDVIVSFYHLNRLFLTQGYIGDFPKYWDYFRRGLQPWTPYWEHIQEGWERRNRENVLFMFYENMIQDMTDSIRKISTFLGFHYSHDQLESLRNHMKIENFKNNESVNGQLMKNLGIVQDNGESFVRNGKNGGWQDYFVGKINKEADEWILENLKETDLKFPHF